MQNPVRQLGEKKITDILQSKQYEMLKTLKRILEENKIEYFLACGTALGCVRHSGFIPWDDDVDIYIWGKDYEKVKDTINNDREKQLQFQDYSVVDGYPYTFPKIVARDTLLVETSLKNAKYRGGVYIDVFPLFCASNNKLVRTIREVVRYIRYVTIKAYYYNYTSGVRKVFSKLARIMVKPERLQKKLISSYSVYFNDAEKVIDPGAFNKQALLSKTSFSDTKWMRFNDIVLPMACGYDVYLTECYGEYMNLPDLADRVSRHNIAELEILGVSELIEGTEVDEK